MASTAYITKVLNLSTQLGDYELIEGHLYKCTYRDTNKMETISIVGTLSEIVESPVTRSFNANTERTYTLRFDCSTEFKSKIIDVKSFDVEKVEYFLNDKDIDKLKSFLNDNMDLFCIERITDGVSTIIAENEVLVPSMTTKDGAYMQYEIPAKIINTVLPSGIV